MPTENSSTRLRRPSSPSSLSPLPENFYLKDAVTIALKLLGKGLLVRHATETLLVEIVETEAYLGDLDPASHCYRGLTPRNWPMFEKGGLAYVYFSYGMHHCMNVVTGPKSRGEAVLLRAGAPLQGLEKMHALRGFEFTGTPHKNLTNGPGKLTAALGIDRTFNGLRLDDTDFAVVDLGRRVKEEEIGVSPRIGISQARELPFRFFLRSSPWVSKKGPVVY